MAAKETIKVNKNVLIFVEDACQASMKLIEGATTPTFEMVAYSGGVIKDHWWWGSLAIDLSGMSFPKKKMPILEDHNTGKKIGFSKKMSIENNALVVKNEDMTFIDTPESLAFRANSAAGFPYEASIYAKPTTVEEVGDGDSVEVNGYTFKGPGTIWRKSIFKEASVCTFGYDPNTKSVAMSECEEELNLEYINKKPKETKLTNGEESKTMNREKFKTEHPEEYAALVKEVTEPIVAKFTAEKAGIETKLADVTASNTILSEENKGAEKRLMALEKNEALRAEKELGFAADAIFTEKFNAAELPERLFSKVKKLVSHEAFVTDGKLDTEAFSAVVDAELKDWSSEDSGSVHGFSTTTKTHAKDDSTKLKADDDLVTRMLGHVGQIKA